MRRGEVWWHEPADSKRRPVLILARDEAVDRVFYQQVPARIISVFANRKDPKTWSA